MVLPIITLPHPLLRKKTTAIKKLDKKILKFINDLQETLKKATEPEGLGLAANQVGVDARIFLVNLKNKGIHVFINPEIIKFSDEEITMTEGCLSIPKLYSEIKRPKKVKVKYQTIRVQNGKEELEEKTEEFDELDARVIQHEQDHLNGIVFLDHALRQKSPIFRLEKNKEGKDEFVEVKI